MLFIVICLLIEFIICVYLLRCNLVSMMLAISLVLLTLIWYFMPGVLIILYKYNHISSRLYYDVTEDEFIKVYLIETIAFCLVVFGFVKMQEFSKVPKKYEFSWPVNGKFLFNLLVFLYLIIFIFQLSHFNFNYLENNAAAIYDSNASGSVLNVFMSIVFSSILFLGVSSCRKSNIFYWSCVIVFMESIVSILSGSRIAFVTPIVLFLFRYVRFNKININRRTILYGMIFLVLLLNIVLPMSYLIGKERRFGKLEMSDVSLLNKVNGYEDNVIQMIFTKFDSFSAGYLLVKKGGFGSAGFEPYYGSFFIFLPRMFWQSRPVAGSSDGTIYGHPSRIIPAVQGIISDSYNVGVSPLSISVWEFGYFGIPVFLIAGVLFLNFINRIVCSTHISSKIIGVYLLNIPTFNLLCPSPDVILKQMIIAIFLLLFFKMHRNIKEKIR